MKIRLEGYPIDHGLAEHIRTERRRRALHGRARRARRAAARETKRALAA